MTATYPPHANGLTRLLAALPPPELRAAFPELDQPCSELQRLREERAEVRRAREAATSERRRAEHDDIEAAWRPTARRGRGLPMGRVR